MVTTGIGSEDFPAGAWAMDRTGTRAAVEITARTALRADPEKLMYDSDN
jgi:hypothetical protein